MGNAPRVMVVEDDRVVQRLLVAVLQAEGYDVVAAADGNTALRRAKTFAPDLALLDVRLGAGIDGIALARRLREQTDDIRLLFLTAADQPDDLRAGFDAGADFYMTKPFSVDALLVRVEVLLRRAGKNPQTRWQVGDLTVDEAAHQVTRGGRPLALRPREFDLLCVLAKRAGRVLAKEHLLNELWGYDIDNPNVVERHISSLRRKLHAHGPPLIHTVRSVGYVIRAEPPE